MDKAEFARRLGVTMDVLEGLIAGTVEMTREHAEALESVTGSPAAYWRMLASKAKKCVV